MVKAFSKALLYYVLPIFCFIVSGLSQSPLRQDSNHAITGSEKFNTALFPSIADQLKKLSHIRNPRQIDSGKLYMDHSGE
ncbi:hypothetical protein DAPPUDRAFT_312329 [Daphnia pulex]|uniref:Uncharacterized protein n=1 Tax=Daphnia pulex TaxID=6669 RepID=E9G0H4_DAPPU|nr:hypothetical protein DAPPUDRAFT_312329 [Daphnia pulex]|eukprot:EFX86903.1 hypothetical protein DAPPUDRAFT_312329 [Daphnia pulex]